MKHLLTLLLFTLFLLSAVAQDSTLALLEDKNLPIETRLDSFSNFIRGDVLNVYPDSAINLAFELQWAAKEAENIEFQVEALFIQAEANRKKGLTEDAAIFYENALNLSQRDDYQTGIQQALPKLSEINSKMKNFEAALNYDQQMLDLAKEAGDSTAMAELHNAIGFNYMKLGTFESAIENFDLSILLSQAIGDTANLISAKENLNQVYAEQGLAEQSLEGNLETLEMHRKSGDQTAIAKTTYNVGLNYKEMGETDSALFYLNDARERYNELGILAGLARSLISLAEINLELGNYDKALEQGKQAQAAATKSLDLELMSEATLDLYAIYNNIGDAQSALDMFTYYIDLRDSVRDMEQQQAAIALQYKYNYQKRALKDSLEFANQQAIKDYQIDKQNAELGRQRIGLFSAAGGLLLILALAYSIYRGKKRSDNLLLNILPAETAKELKKKGFAQAREYQNASVLFTDFKEFTDISEGLSPEELVATIDECFKAFDERVGKYNIEKIKTIGDSYMAAGGLPIEDQGSPEDVVSAAIEMRDWMLEHKKSKGNKGFEMRLGIHTGPVVAGIVGIKKFQYDIWGDTVNTASRMESNGEVGKVCISASTYEAVKDQFDCEHRGKIQVKGKGEMDMYFVEIK